MSFFDGKKLRSMESEDGDVVKLNFDSREPSGRGDGPSDFFYVDRPGPAFDLVRREWKRGGRLVAAGAGGGFKMSSSTWEAAAGQAIARVKYEAFGGGTGVVITLANGAKIRCEADASGAPASAEHSWDHGREAGFIFPVGLAVGTDDFPRGDEDY